MKKRLSMIVAFVACAATVLSLGACAKNNAGAGAGSAEFANAAVDDEVVVETYIQDKESWWDGKGTFYAGDKDAAYLLYEVACTEEEYNKLTVGTKVKVTGVKAEWSGEVEIADAKVEILSGSTYTTTATEIKAADFKDNLNKKVVVKDLTVVASTDADGNEKGSLYSWDGSGAQGDSVYFTANDGTTDYVFNVRNYLRGSDTDVYKAAEALEVGDKITVECYVYWYEDAAQPRVISITK